MDEDSMGDEWEMEYTDDIITFLPEDDLDEDGLSNLDEFCVMEEKEYDSMKLYYPFEDMNYVSDSSQPRITDVCGVNNFGRGQTDGGDYPFYTSNTKFGRGMSFNNGNTNLMELNYDNDAVEIKSELDIGTVFTLDMWIYPKKIPGFKYEGDNRIYYSLYDASTNEIARFLLLDLYDCDGSIYAWFGNNQIRFYNNDALVQFGKWNHVTFSVDYTYGKASCFVNGFEAGVFDCGVVDLNTKNAKIGGLKTTEVANDYSDLSGDTKTVVDYSVPFYGNMDEIKIYDKALSPGDGIGGNCAFKAGFEENICESDIINTVYDRSENSLTGKSYGCEQRDNPFLGGKCLKFDGNSDYVEFSDIEYISGKKNAITLEAYVNLNENTGSHTIIDTATYALCVRWDGKLYFEIAGPQAIVSSCTSSHSIFDQASDWVHIAATYDGTNMEVYINGIQKGSKKVACPGSIISFDFDTLQIGGGGGVVGSPFDYSDGLIDDVRIYTYKKPIGIDVLQLPLISDASDNSIFENENVVHGGLSVSYDTCKYLDSSYKFDGNDDYISMNIFEGYDIEKSLTIESWINIIEENATHPILTKGDSYGLWINADNSVELKLKLGSSVVGFKSKRKIDDKWNHIAATFDRNSVKIYINGFLDVVHPAKGVISVDYFDEIDIGRSSSDDAYARAYMTNVVLSNYAKSFNEDSDGDNMADRYEIIRSHAKNSDQYNPYEYNGRYALLVAPVRKSVEEDDGLQFKFDITMMRDYLVSNGWNDNDIIFLTCENGDGRADLSDTDGSLFNGNWIDGEAYEDNILDVLDIFSTGGKFTIKDSMDRKKILNFPKISNSDTVFMEFRDHGSQVQDTDEDESDSKDGYLQIYDSEYVKTPLLDDDLGDKMDNIQTRYMILEVDSCFSGEFKTDCKGSNRAVITSQDSSNSERYHYLYYGRINGKIVPYIYENGLKVSTTQNDEDKNADGVIGVTNNEEAKRGDSYRDGIISVQEAHYYAEVVCNDKGVVGNNPQSHFGSELPVQLYI
ncbi:MAG: hypothetical protein GF329_05420 [Candidatus Lokiarchaeota archaeon]|nr:hypothetical protein [Candidatus Lokiarchaeota archaeon]